MKNMVNTGAVQRFSTAPKLASVWRRINRIFIGSAVFGSSHQCEGASIPDGATQVLGVRLFDRLPGHIYSGLTAEQKTAIATAASESPWRQQPIDIRCTPRPAFGAY